MRRRRTIPILIAVALVVAGCNSNNAADTTAVEADATTTTVVETTMPDDGELLPEGVYRSGEVNRDELIAAGVAAGFSAEEAEAFLDDVDQLRDYVEISHRLEDGVWTTTVSFDTGVEDVFQPAPFEVVDAQTVIAPGLCGPVTLGYAIDGDSVTFEVIEDECDELDRFFNVLNFELAPFIRVADEAGDPPLTLRLAVPYCDDDLEAGVESRYTPAVSEFVNGLRELSQGSLDFEFVRQVDGSGEFCGLADGEQLVVQAVAEGTVDLAWAGTRVFDTVGVTSFQALHAPLLVDSYELQSAIVDSDIPDQMLAGLEDIGVEGLALLAGGLRVPIGREAPLLDPEDYQGITFQIYRSQTQAAAVEALGASVTDVVAGVRDAGLVSGEIDGHEHSLRTYVVRGNTNFAPYVTANVHLWPETVVLLANPESLASLSAQQQEWIRQAAVVASAGSAELYDQDADLAAAACEQGAMFAEASDEDLAGLAEAFQPVYENLRGDSQTAGFIDQILALKASINPEPTSVPDGCAVQTSS